MTKRLVSQQHEKGFTNYDIDYKFLQIRFQSLSIITFVKTVNRIDGIVESISAILYIYKYIQQSRTHIVDLSRLKELNTQSNIKKTVSLSVNIPSYIVLKLNFSHRILSHDSLRSGNMY